MTQWNPNLDIFQACDIRGIFGKTLFEKDAEHLGFAFAMALKDAPHKAIAVLRDARQSSPILSEALIRGITMAGWDAVDLGVGPTPLLYYSVDVLDVAGGIMITASHNPKDYNGFKLCTTSGPFFGEALKKLTETRDFSQKAAVLGRKEERFMMSCYTSWLTKGLTLTGKPLKIIWDMGNGVCGETTAGVMGKISAIHVLINATPDPSFPVHHADPADLKNMVQLKNFVLKERADLGVAFDADGDRVGFVDKKGNVWFGEDLAYLFTDDLLKKHPGASFIVDVKMSDQVADWVKARGGHVILNRTGHAFIKEALKTSPAIFAVEYSGHVYFKERFTGMDDGLYAALRVIELIMQGASLSDLYATFPEGHGIGEELVTFPNHQAKQAAMETLKTLLQKEGVAFSDLDGIRVSKDMGWWLIRGSNTVPALTLRVEGASLKGLHTMQAEMDGYLKKAALR